MNPIRSDKFSIELISMAVYALEMFPIERLHSFMLKAEQQKLGKYF